MADTSLAEGARIWWRLLGLALASLALAGAFWGGFELGRVRVGALAESGLAALQRERDAAIAERGALEQALADARQESVVLERSRQIERETNRSLQDQLRQAQNERLALLKESTYLRRLIRDGGQGAVRVHDLRVVPGAEPHSFRYSFAVTRLAAESGDSSGWISLRVEGARDGKPARLDRDRLRRSRPWRFPLRLDPIQSFQGDLELPEGFEPQTVTVVIDLDGDALESTAETFAWSPDEPQ